MEQNKQKSNGARADIDELINPFTGLLNERDIGQYFRTGRRTFRQYPLGFMGFTLIILFVKVGLMILANKNYLIGFLLGIFIYPFAMGDYIVSAKLLQKQPCKFSDFFSTFRYYRSLVIYTSIYEIIYYIQYLVHNYFALSFLCGLTIPVLSLLLLFTPLIIVDRRPGVWQALGLSRRTVQGQLSGILMFGFYIVLVLVGPAIALYLGISIAWPGLSGFATRISVTLSLISIGTIANLILQPIVSCAITAVYADLLGLQSEKY